MWEYRQIETDRVQLASLLNQLGTEGWELVHFQLNPLTADVIGVMQRRKEP